MRIWKIIDCWHFPGMSKRLWGSHGTDLLKKMLSSASHVQSLAGIWSASARTWRSSSHSATCPRSWACSCAGASWPPGPSPRRCTRAGSCWPGSSRSRPGQSAWRRWPGWRPAPPARGCPPSAPAPTTAPTWCGAASPTTPSWPTAGTSI